MTTVKQPKYVLCEATKATQAEAVNWARHVARISQKRCRVTFDPKLRRWRIWKES